MRITVHLPVLPVVWPTKQNKVCEFSIELGGIFHILATFLETKVFKIFSTYRPNQSFEITSQWRLYKQYA